MPLINLSKLKETRLGLATRLAQIIDVDVWGVHEVNFDALKARWPETVEELAKWHEANSPKQDVLSIDFKKLTDFDENLCRRVSGFLNINDDGVHLVDLSALRPGARLLLAKFVREVMLKPDEPEIFRIDTKEAANRQRLVDEEAGLARLQWYADERGLLPVPENAVAVRDWLDVNVRGYWSGAGVDAAISNLRATLRWKPKQAPPAVAPDPIQPEPIRLLDNGEPELPLTATETQMRRASVAQLRDLSRRRAEGRQAWRTGWKGASL
jgi:hypothetical protein